MLSTLLHALLLFADRMHFGERNWQRGRQIVIQASLRSPPNAALAPAGAAPGAASVPPERVPAGRAPAKEAAKAASEPARAAIVLADPGAPEYPDDAVRRKLESCVLAAVLVSATGEVQSVRILHADVAALFERAVIDAYSAARYLPAQANGENVPSRVLAVASFVLSPERSRPCASRYAAAARRINALPFAAEIAPGLVESLLDGAR